MKFPYPRLDRDPSSIEPRENDPSGYRPSAHARPEAPDGLTPMRWRSRLPDATHKDSAPPTEPPRRMWRHEQPRQQALIGKAIHPEVAHKLMDRVAFDGIGRIEGFNPRPQWERHCHLTEDLTRADLRMLEHGRVQPLTAQANNTERTAPRTERECLIRLIHVLTPPSSAAETSLQRTARELWLTGIVNKDSLMPLLNRATREVPRAKTLISQLLNETEQSKSLPQYHDNIYGRRFETELVRRLVEDPPAGVLKAVDAICKRTLMYVDQLPEDRHENLVNTVWSKVATQKRPWFSRVPEVDVFVQENSLASLKAALTAPSNGYDVMKILFVTHWINSVLSKEESGPAHFKYSDHVYDILVKAKRGAESTPLRLNTNGIGIGLAHQPPARTYQDFHMGESVTYVRSPDMKEPTPFTLNALLRGAIYVNDLSGNTSLISPLLERIKEAMPEFSPQDGLLALCMFTGFDGGHSFEDVLVTSAGVKEFERRAKEYAKPGIDAKAWALEAAVEETGQACFTYDHMAQLLSNPADRAKVRKMQEAALDATIALCSHMIHHLGMRT